MIFHCMFGLFNAVLKIYNCILSGFLNKTGHTNS